METKWEQVTYRDETARVLIQFIAVNADMKLKAAFLGKKNYCIVLEDHDKQAIKDAFQLSEALRRKTVLVNETTALQKKISIP